MATLLLEVYALCGLLLIPASAGGFTFLVVRQMLIELEAWEVKKEKRKNG